MILGCVCEGPRLKLSRLALSEAVCWRERFGTEFWPRERDLLAADGARDPRRPPVEAG